ncbi:MAG: PDDEXK nuclease domain-containing protein [Ornithinimicrobium sp.]
MPQSQDPQAAESSFDSGYPEALVGIKKAIAQAQNRAVRTVNVEMIELYWKIGQIILDRQERHGWGKKVIQRLSADLRALYPGQRGFSVSNLDYMRRFAGAVPTGPISQQPIGKLGWGSVTILLDKLDTREERDFYAARAAQSGWSQAVLRDRIRGQLHLREGSAPSTFERTLSAAEQPVAQELARDPWIFDFLRLEHYVSEREVERALVDNLAKVLVELGTGFAYMGRQFRLVVGGDEFFLDLLFYHVRHATTTSSSSPCAASTTPWPSADTHIANYRLTSAALSLMQTHLPTVWTQRRIGHACNSKTTTGRPLPRSRDGRGPGQSRPRSRA